MENNPISSNRPANPRRRKRSKMQIFKEAYLPVIIAGSALLMILTFIIGSIVRGVQRNRVETQAQLAASIAESKAQENLKREANDLSEKAALLSAGYDYDAAISLLDSFSGDISQFPALTQLRQECEQAKSTLILWDDIENIPNLSFQLLIADPSRAFIDAQYGSSYNKNFVTINEFADILQMLYENNYVLIGLSDITDPAKAEKLYLPTGKKPLILTQTQVNYYTYMTDSNGDLLPDAGGDGFASKLVITDNGNLTCEMVTATGETVTGAYDLVPMLEAFIETHPDFSYKGARAVLAVTGYDGLFGYRTNPSSRDSLGQTRYESEIAGATKVVQALRSAGYEIACYTYSNIAYGNSTVAKIRSDLTKWQDEVSPILGVVDTLVYARNSDIASSDATYSGDKFTALIEFGFTNFLGFANSGQPWFHAEDGYNRQGRILVSGNNIKKNPGWFDGLFDTNDLLDSNR